MTSGQIGTNKMIKILVISLVCGITFFVFMLYATIKTKSTNVSSYPPFQTYMQKTLTLQRETFLFEEDDSFVEDKDYAYTLLDKQHSQWQYFQDRLSLQKPDVKLVKTFPVGTQLYLDKAVQYTNGVSGFSSPAVLGTIRIDEKKYNVNYRWGNLDLARSLDKVEACWKFELAPWQKIGDSSYYALPDAEWW